MFNLYIFLSLRKLSNCVLFLNLHLTLSFHHLITPFYPILSYPIQSRLILFYSILFHHPSPHLPSLPWILNTPNPHFYNLHVSSTPLHQFLFPFSYPLYTTPTKHPLPYFFPCFPCSHPLFPAAHFSYFFFYTPILTCPILSYPIPSSPVRTYSIQYCLITPPRTWISHPWIRDTPNPYFHNLCVTSTPLHQLSFPLSYSLSHPLPNIPFLTFSPYFPWTHPWFPIAHLPYFFFYTPILPVSTTHFLTSPPEKKVRGTDGHSNETIRVSVSLPPLSSVVSIPSCFVWSYPIRHYLIIPFPHFFPYPSLTFPSLFHP